MLLLLYYSLCHNVLDIWGYANQLEWLLTLLQPGRKRKYSSSGAANSTGTGNTVGPSPNSPPSTHTPGEGMTTASSMQHVNNMHKSLMMNGPEGAGGLASSSNLLVILLVFMFSPSHMAIFMYDCRKTCHTFKYEIWGCALQSFIEIWVPIWFLACQNEYEIFSQ